MPYPPGRPGAHAVLSGVEDGGQAQLLQGLPERVELLVGGVEALQARVELESAGAEVHGLVLGALRWPRRRCGGSTLPNGIRTSLFRAAPAIVRDAVGLVLELGPGVHGEDDGGHVQFAVDLGDPVQRRACGPRP